MKIFWRCIVTEVAQKYELINDRYPKINNNKTLNFIIYFIIINN